MKLTNLLQRKRIQIQEAAQLHIPIVQAEIHHAFQSQVARPKKKPYEQICRCQTVHNRMQVQLEIYMSTQTEEYDSSKFLGRPYFDKHKYYLIEPSKVVE